MPLFAVFPEPTDVDTAEPSSETDAVRVARAVFRAIVDEDLQGLAEYVHDAAEWEMVNAQGTLVRGRAAVVEAFARAIGDLHHVSAHGVHPLGEDAVIVTGRSQHRIPAGGFADSPVVWLHELRDGKLWRVRIFASVAAAREAWAGREGV
jgi:ketosteroid isomerase-like protein